MLQALIFDIGNVLLSFDPGQAFEKLEAQSDDFKADTLAVVEKLKAASESGLIDRDNFEQSVVEALGFRGSRRDFSLIWQDIFTVNQPMVDFVESIHGKVPLFLLSNTSAIHLEHILEKNPVFRLFDDAIYSHEVHLVKPDPEIFRLAERQFRVIPEQTAYIDDLLANIKSAREVGFRGLHYDMADHDLVISEIRSLLP